MNNEIVMINTECILSHPDNPRKSLGDLTELVSSVKGNGILQNLTVVPRVSEVTKMPIDGQYIAVIGHRRLAAAKLAGLEKVPCVISDMDYKTQVSTMLLENMQRNDLTPYEQAQGFQMMLDLGESISGIVEKTGFSESTVRHRIKLTELDQELLAEKSAKNISITELIKLEEIKDTEEKNELLKAIGTDDFNWKYRQAKNQQERKKKKDDLLEIIERVAKPKEEATCDLTYGMYFDYYYEIETLKERLREIENEELFYDAAEYGVTIYKEKVIQEETEDEEDKSTEDELNRLRENHDKLKEIWAQMMSACDDFIKGYSEAKIKNSNAVLIEYAARTYLENREAGYYEIVEFAGIDKESEKYLDADGDIDEDLVTEDLLNTSARKAFLYGVYTSHKPNEWEVPYGYSNHFVKNEQVLQFYDLMKRLGYKLSSEEQQILDGTHELYEKEEM